MIENAERGNELGGVRKRALITGISGQDGSYLAELLLAKGYEVHGLTRSRSLELGCSTHLKNAVRVHRVANDESQWMCIVEQLRPDELYHLAADSFVPRGWEHPLENLQSNLGLTVSLLEAIRKLSPQTKMLNACSREVFGNCKSALANENTPMQPVTPYGINKAASRWAVEAYRQRYDLFAANAILFNHESPRRGKEFVTRKITKTVAEIRLGLAGYLELGNVEARRDWGYAGDFVCAMWRILQQDQADDFVIGTGKTHTIRDFAARAFAFVGLDWVNFVRSVNRLSRPCDTVGIAADNSKARSLLDWTPQVSFEGLVEMMVAADVQLLDNRENRSRAA